MNHASAAPTTLDTTGTPWAMPTESAKHTDEQGITEHWQFASFDTVGDMMAAAMRRLPAVNDTGLMRTIIHHSEDSPEELAAWYGIPGGCPAVMTALNDGYQPGVDLVEALLKTLPATAKPPVSRIRRRAWSDAGDSVDMQRVYGGTLDRAFQRTTRQAGRAPRVVRLVVSLNGSSKTPSVHMAWRGVAALALSKLLTAGGYAVEIVGVICNTDLYPGNAHPALRVEVTLKAAHSPLDISTLSGALTVMGFARHVGFAIKAHGATKCGGHMGVSTWPELAAFQKPGDVTGFQNVTSAATAAAFVAAKLADIEAAR